MLLRYKTSQAKYICRGCVLGEGDPESLKTAWRDIEVLMALEEKTVKAAEADASFVSVDNNLTVSEKGDGGSKSMEAEIAIDGTSARESQGNDKSTSKPDEDSKKPSLTTCKFYMQKSCKHGRKGVGCNYSHPKLCYSYIKRGDKKGGCKKGDQCNYAHPKLCKRALESKVCSNKRCRLSCIWH